MQDQEQKSSCGQTLPPAASRLPAMGLSVIAAQGSWACLAIELVGDGRQQVTRRSGRSPELLYGYGTGASACKVSVVACGSHPKRLASPLVMSGST